MKYVSKIPVLRTVVKIVRFFVLRMRTYRSDRSTLLQLSDFPPPYGEQIVQVLNEFRKPLPASEDRLIKKIETERSRFLKQHSLLVNGSFGDGGLYDKGVTISSACKVSKPPRQCLLMYKLIRLFKPKIVIELGTNIGISSAFQAAALSINGPEGRLVTLEASPYRLHLAKSLHQTLALENVSYVEGLFSDTLNQVLDDYSPIDFSFIDGHHQYQPTLDYFTAIWNHVNPSALFVFDDIRWSDGMKQAWSEIQKDNRLSIAVDLNSMGICVGASGLVTGPYATGPIISPLATIL